MEWSTEHEQLNQWSNRLQPFTDHCVGSIVPSGFEAVGRLFHPVQLDDGYETWADVAERNGRVVHPEMQLHALGSGDSWWGELPKNETELLREVVARHTTTPDRCWFGVWQGYGGLYPQTQAWLTRPTANLFARKPPSPPGLLPEHIERAGPAKLNGRHRPHFLLEGSLADLDQARVLLGNQTPNLWWPEDQSWFVASEIDFCWTLIGGSNALIDELTQTNGLEVLRSGYDHRGTHDADRIN